MELCKQLMVKPGAKVSLARHDPKATPGVTSREEAEADLMQNLEEMQQLHELLYADNRHALLIILQAMDAGGKDGTIRHVMSGMNPLGVSVTSFKAPSTDELDHDFLWRIHKAVPPRGEVGVFNRSHYEDVLIVRVRDLVPKAVWSERYDIINEFERLLSVGGMKILKFFLHVSKDEQLKRLKERIDDPSKNWKFNPGDFEERKRWDDYMKAYEDALSRCSTEHAPWYIIPADRKWYRNFAISHVITETLAGMDLRYPPLKCDFASLKIE